ncbi:unnamed protein product [Rotaria sp. Silwood2]|nr:unnamed protein product [Rotaria sp. Silwood2]
MGIKFDKIEPYAIMGDSFPLYVVDTSKVDVAGETRLNNEGAIAKLIGLMVHVTAKAKTGETKYRHGRVTITPDQDLIHIVGRLHSIMHVTPIQWASQLRNIGETIYIQLIQSNNNQEVWNFNVTCQIFVKKMIEHVNLNYPATILTCSDLPPTIVDFSILCLRSPACMKHKSSVEPTPNDEEH